MSSECAILNLNDGLAVGTRLRLREQLKPFTRRFILRLLNYGDADMINYFTEDGERIEPMPREREPLGREYGALLKRWDGTHTAPFSCHHMYARTDSRWATAYETPLEAHRGGFDRKLGELIPGYFSYEVPKDRIAATPMQRVPMEFHEPHEFGDDWSEPLGAEEVGMLSAYFRKFEHLARKFRFIELRVGGRNHVIDLEGPKGRGITFEAPRTSLMTAIRYEIFDDLLIGNFVKTTLHGDLHSLYPDFTPYVAKYGDNGRAFSVRELHDYFLTYRRESGFQGWLDQVRVNSTRKLRRGLLATLRRSPALYRAARSTYRRITG